MMESIYIASALATDKDNNGKHYGKTVYEQLKAQLNGRVQELQQHKQNIWCRDYLPVKNADGQWVQFRYAPAYMSDTEKWKARIPDPKPLLEALGLQEVQHSDIILDGGNVELHGSKAIVSDRVFRDNRENNKYSNELELLAALKQALAVEKLVIVPQHPLDFTDHVDGMVRFIDADTVLINDLQPELEAARKDIASKQIAAKRKGMLVENWYYAFLMALQSAGLKWKVLPCTVQLNETEMDGSGIYLNFLQLQDTILMPVYNRPEDSEAAELLTKYYDKPIIKIEASELAQQGGMINCISWTKG